MFIFALEVSVSSNFFISWDFFSWVKAHVGEILGNFTDGSNSKRKKKEFFVDTYLENWKYH